MKEFLETMGCIFCAMLICAVIFGLITGIIATFTYFHELLEALKDSRWGLTVLNSVIQSTDTQPAIVVE